MAANDTIFALASGAGRAGLAILRISGPGAGAAARAIAGRARLPAPRRAVRAAFVDPESGEALDDGLLLWFAAPASYTGEDVVELHIHGGRATVAAVSSALAALPGLRLAEPGEFTRRAFLSGKVDLTAAEAVADLVDAETDAQRRLALRQLSGGLRDRLDAWRARLVALLARVEALIDFADEDLPPGVAAEVAGGVAALAAEIRAFLDDDRRGERVRDGLHVAIVGPPNVGKSSLLNAIARRDVAIVSEVAGTTRDVIDVRLDLGGWPVTVSDTAGLRPTVDGVEQEGVRRARRRALEADVRVVVFDATAGERPDPDSVALVGEGAVPVANKCDRALPKYNKINGIEVVRVSATKGTGLPDLLTALEGRAAVLAAVGEAAPITRLRHRTALTACVAALERAGAATDVELVAEDMRVAAREIGRVTGRVDVEDLLDVIFRDFCIGK